MDEPKTLLLKETGIVRLDDGTEAVNVGPIVAALGFITEGRGDDRGADEHGQPLPDLLSLAFDVVRSIIVGGRHADYFRKVKADFDAQSELDNSTSLGLAKQAQRQRSAHAALLKAGLELQARLQKLEQAAANLLLELESFGGSGASAGRDRRKSSRAKRVRATSEPRAAIKPKARAKPRVAAKPRSTTQRRAAAKSRKQLAGGTKKRGSKRR